MFISTYDQHCYIKVPMQLFDKVYNNIIIIILGELHELSFLYKSFWS